MGIGKSCGNDLFYSLDSEWINFQGKVAFIGICRFKLTGFKKEIQQIIFSDPEVFKKKGEVIAIIRYKDYQIEVHMPVEGTLIQINKKIVKGERNILLEYPEKQSFQYQNNSFYA